MLGAQTLAHFCQQRFLLGAAQITHFDFGRIDLTTGATERNQFEMMITTIGDQCGLGAHVIDCIDDEIIPVRTDQRVEIAGIDKFFNLMHATVRIDLRDTLRQGSHFGLSQRVGQRMNLAIDVRLGQMVQVDHGDFTDRATCQRLDNPRADPADTDHADMGGAKARQRSGAIQTRNAAETALAVDHVGGCFNSADGGCVHGVILADDAARFCDNISFTFVLLLFYFFPAAFALRIVVSLRSPLFQLILVSIAAHIALAGARVTTSLYALSLHASEFTVGTLVALFSLFPMLLAVSTGRWLDRVGVVRPMSIGLSMMCLGCALPSVMSGLAVLYLATTLIGTGFMAIQIAAQYTVGAISKSEHRAGNFSLLAMGFSVSSFTGPVLAGVLIDHLGYRIAYGTAAGFACAALALLSSGNLRHLPHTPVGIGQSANHPFSLLRDRAMRQIYWVGILLSAAWDLFIFVVPIHGSHLGFSASTIGLILGCFSAATFTVRLLMPWLNRRLTEWQILTTALALAVLCYGLFPYFRHPGAVMLVASLLGLALGSAQPNVLTLLHDLAPAGRAGEAVGVRSTIGAACQIVLPLTFGAAGATLGLYSVFWGMGVLIASGMPTAWRNAGTATDRRV